MKKMNSTYRLQVIKEIATRRRLTSQGDLMACHISQLLDGNHENKPVVEKHFTGCHYDDSVGGWVSNLWDQKK
ncbi:hypothetical protein [Photobacterium nomapromontoriensis]|uniref:hypothetical protein n=1 Tax=Photobacterium nomapromontoriensis TaxID=2910237 RepID=UPI003D101EBF